MFESGSVLVRIQQLLTREMTTTAFWWADVHARITTHEHESVVKSIIKVASISEISRAVVGGGSAACFVSFSIRVIRRPGAKIAIVLTFVPIVRNYWSCIEKDANLKIDVDMINHSRQEDT